MTVYTGNIYLFDFRDFDTSKSRDNGLHTGVCYVAVVVQTDLKVFLLLKFEPSQ